MAYDQPRLEKQLSDLTRKLDRAVRNAEWRNDPGFIADLLEEIEEEARKLRKVLRTQ